MKKKSIEAVPAIQVKADGWKTTVQNVKGILVFNIYKNKTLLCRHCFNPETKEYASYIAANGVWNNQRITECYETMYDTTYGYPRTGKDFIDRSKLKEEYSEMVWEQIKPYTDAKWKSYKPNEWADAISDLETDGKREGRELAEMRRIKRVVKMMDRIPDIPDGLAEWIDRKANDERDYCLKDRKNGVWTCSACGGKMEKLPGKPKDKTEITCPMCGKKILYMARKESVQVKTHFALAQPIDQEISVVRYFSASIDCWFSKKKNMLLQEDVRIVLFKKGSRQFEKLHWNCDIYYRQWNGTFDNKGNPINRKEYPGFMYDAGLEETLKDTAYEPWTRLFKEFSETGLELDYNKMMIMYKDQNYRTMVEMLYRGRFYQLLQEACKDINIWHVIGYIGPLDEEGECIEDVFEIEDRQKINRIRDKNGGRQMLAWMRKSDEEDMKISDKALDWLSKNKLEPRNMEVICRFMSLEKAVNYIERQNKEQYPKRTAYSVLNQYEDYIDMCRKLKKNLADEMIYRPRELKRRHDEAVNEVEARQAELVADEYSKKFGEAERVMNEIREKFEYTGQNYQITVPHRIVNIVEEGRALHHCVGATDRYFDRIKNHETYICFLRKTEAPDEPFYTIEVEPGGTIRQHRGMYDEEPDIEKVKPFLREWQQVIRKRMKAEDHERAARSKEKREENIAELKQKNNTRVLEGLMEDFMEAVG
ncbi:PcfJ domain-containing protein [Clostridium sp. OF09-36]|uniref:PcfJ domain-containing protein n=1 Tax=Clostridium sp. OF09-36 TaxID=2292310 RepID=UPI0015F921A2|nr:PcfJ domain-containing protein [Clostridium sp. OF09-36]